MISNYFMDLSERIHALKQQISAEEVRAHRPEGSVKLIAVSKGHTFEAIRQSHKVGLVDFAESYLQEAQIKITQLTDLPITWHFIGPIQSNKTRAIATSFSWVHSVSRLKIAQLLNEARPLDHPPLNVCLQINLDNEDTKTGIPPTEALRLAEEITNLPRLCLRGLMAIPRQETDEEKQYLSFLRLAELREQLNRQLTLSMDTLSMGMSHDFQAAIRAGSTMVRVGTAIFGERSVSRG